MNKLMAKRIVESISSELLGNTVVDLLRYSRDDLLSIKPYLSGYSKETLDYVLGRIDDSLQIKREREMLEAVVVTGRKYKDYNVDSLMDDKNILSNVIFIDYDNVVPDNIKMYELAKYNNVIVVCNNASKLDKLKSTEPAESRLLSYKLTDMSIPQATDNWIIRTIIDCIDMYPTSKIYVVSKDNDYKEFSLVNDIKIEVIESLDSIPQFKYPKILNLKELNNVTRIKKRRHVRGQEMFGTFMNLVPTYDVIDNKTLVSSYESRLLEANTEIERLQSLLEKNNITYKLEDILMEECSDIIIDTKCDEDKECSIDE